MQSRSGTQPISEKAVPGIIQPMGNPESGMRQDQRSISPACLCQETSGPGIRRSVAHGRQLERAVACEHATKITFSKQGRPVMVCHRRLISIAV